MSINTSVSLLGVLFIVILIARIVQNYLLRKKLKKLRNKEILSTNDVINVLFNVGLFTAGIISISLSLGFTMFLFGEDLAFTQPIINFLAGVLFIWFAFRNIFYGGKV